MAIRKRIWIYNDAATNTLHFQNSSTSHTFTNILDYINCSYVMVSSANSYRYVDLSAVTDYTIQSGDYLEYDVYWNGSGNLQIGIDLICSDGSYLRGTTAAVDQNGLNAHPATDLSAYATNKWYRRRIPITTMTLSGSPVSSVGKVIQFYDLTCEADGSATYSGYFKNIAITDGNGVGEDSAQLNTFAQFFE